MSETGAVALTVEDLRVSIGDKDIIHGVSFELAAGERLGIIGGSGSGKTITALAIAGLLPPTARVSGSARMDGRELLGLGDHDLAAIRGDQPVAACPATMMRPPVARWVPAMSAARAA